MRSLWRHWKQRSGEEISPVVGLTFGALYLVAVGAVGLSAVYVQRAELNRQHVKDMQTWALWVAQTISRADSTNPEHITREIRRAAREESVRYCALVSADGRFVAHSDPTRVGSPSETYVWQEGAGVVSVGTHPDRDVTVLRCPIPQAAGRPATMLWIGLSPIRYSLTQSDLLFWTGYVLLAVLGLYLLAYRLLRRAVQPLAVIRRRLVGSDAPIAERLVALRLNDSFDEISTSWNRLIEFVAEMQEQLRRSHLATDVTAAMDGYRSERLTRILMQIPFGILVIDSEGKVSFGNRAAAGLLGSDGEPLEGRDASELFDESLRLTLLAPQTGGKTGTVSTSRWTDHTFARPHGDVALRFWSIPADATSTETILFVQDVTQAKEAERARDNFLYHVTHELRTPLTNIRAYAETLSQGVIEDEQTIRECYNVIMGETQRLNRLVEDILNVSQLEVGSARLDVGEVQLDKLMRSVVQDTQGAADAKNIDLVLNLPAKVPQLRGDKERLAVVMTNLVGNAIKYTPAGGRVDVRCVAENGRVRVSVTDTGIGIKKEDQERIFDKFYRVDDEQVSAIPGTGLGLAIVKETVRLHGGAVFVESTPGQGSTFTVTLPALAVDESATSRTAKA
jgi:PAS domain S-box-containing protein